MDKINIASLNIDVSALVKSSKEAKSALDDIKKEQKELEKQGQTSSTQYIQNAADIKSLTSAYNLNIKALSDSTKAMADQENRSKLLEVALSNEVTTIDEARASNKLLTELRNSANATTEEGIKEIKLLNAALDKNNEFIEENADAYLKLKLNIGNYADGMKEALNNLNPLNGGLVAFIGRAQEAGGVGNLFKTSLSGIATGIGGVTKASLAFIATPIGAVIALIGVALGSLYNYLTSTQKGIDAVTSVTRPLQAVFTALLSVVNGLGEKLVAAFTNPKKALNELYNFLKQNLINRFEALGVILEGIKNLDFKKVANGVLQAGTGVENLTDKIKGAAQGIGNLMSDAINKGKEIDKLNKEIAKGQLEYNRLTIKYGDLIDEQLLVSKDTARSFQDRKAASLEIIRLTGELSQKEEAIIQNKIRALQLEQQLKGAKNLTNEEQQKLIDLQVQLDEAQDRALNARLEQQRVISGAEKEERKLREEAASKALADALAFSQAQLDILRQEGNVIAMSAEQRLALMDMIAEKAKEVNQKEFEASEKTQADILALKLANGEADLELIRGRTEILIEASDRELQLYRDQNAMILEDGKIFNDALLAQKLEILNKTAELERQAQLTRFEEGTINEQAYNDAINVINEENRVAVQELKEANRIAEQEKALTDLENERAASNENFIVQMAIQAKEDEIKKQQELDAAEKTGASKDLIEAKYAKQAKERDRLVAENKVDIASSTLTNIISIVGKESTAGKVAAIAQATIDTYKGAVSAYSAMSGIPIVGPVLGAVAAGAVVAAGLINVKKIASTSTPKAEKGAVLMGGRRHSTGGNTLFDGAGNSVIEAEAGEAIGILNRNATGHFMDFNNAFNRQSAPSFSTSGGSISQSSKSSVDLAPLGAMFAEAVSQLPPPVVAIEDINYASMQQAKVVSNGDLS